MPVAPEPTHSFGDSWESYRITSSPIVVINACVELGKLYGEKDTPGFINGLLDQLCKNHKIKVS